MILQGSQLMKKPHLFHKSKKVNYNSQPYKNNLRQNLKTYPFNSRYHYRIIRVIDLLSKPKYKKKYHKGKPDHNKDSRKSKNLRVMKRNLKFKDFKSKNSNRKSSKYRNKD